MKMNKALFLFGMLLLAAVVSAQEAVNNVEADAASVPLPNARRLNTLPYYGKGYYPGYGYGYNGYGFPYGFPGYGYGRGFYGPRLGFGLGLGFRF